MSVMIQNGQGVSINSCPVSRMPDLKDSLEQDDWLLVLRVLRSYGNLALVLQTSTLETKMAELKDLCHSGQLSEILSQVKNTKTRNI